mgnify:CR=1 FL=1
MSQLAWRPLPRPLENDDSTHQIFTELGRNFITPFDREDIHYLASALDDIADYIFATSKKINFYKVNPNDSGIQKLAELILQGSVEITKAVKGLTSPHAALCKGVSYSISKI